MDNKEILANALKSVENAKQEIYRRRNEEDRKFIVSQIGKDLVGVLTPLLGQISDNSKLNRDELKDIFKSIRDERPEIIVQPPEVNVTVPDIQLPDIIIPDIKIPTIKVPKAEVSVKIPEIKIPKIEIPPFPKEMKVDGLVGLKGIDRDNPLPVILTDEKGMFYKAFGDALTTVIGAGGGLGAGLIGALKFDSNGFLKVNIAAGSSSVVGGGAEATAQRVTIANDSTGLLSIDDNAGSLTVDQGTATNLKCEPDGTVAHDAADANNPIKIGAKAITALSGATMVAAADRTDLYADEDGVLITKPLTSNNDMLVERVSNTDGASTALTIFGATANSYNCITTIVVHNAHATTNGYVDIRDGTAGTVMMTIPLPANGGAVVNLTVPLRQTTANTALAFDVSAAITTVYLSFVGYKSKA